MADITVKELKERLDAGEALVVVDVRETWEWENGHITELNIPMGTVPVRINELDQYKDQELVINCRSGGRSGQITNYLSGQGFSKVRNLAGGMLAWKSEIDPSFNVE